MIPIHSSARELCLLSGTRGALSGLLGRLLAGEDLSSRSDTILLSILTGRIDELKASDSIYLPEWNMETTRKR